MTLFSLLQSPDEVLQGIPEEVTDFPRTRLDQHRPTDLSNARLVRCPLPPEAKGILKETKPWTPWFAKKEAGTPRASTVL